MSRSLSSLITPTTTTKFYQPAYDPRTAFQIQPETTSNVLDLITNHPGLTTGWASKIGNITTQAATAKKRTNPLLAAPLEEGRRKNPFIIPQTPSADLFGLNIPT